MRITQPGDMAEKYDLVVIGSGFGSLFFVQKYLQRTRRTRVAILEWGEHHTHQWQLENRRNAALDQNNTLVNQNDKRWLYTIGVGGGTNCWWGLSPRLHPSDFELQTRYGVGVDWPISYSDLEPYYLEAERTMLVAGPDDLGGVYPGSRRYPARQHHFTSADRLMKAQMPDQHFAIPSARLRDPLGSRSSCCASAVCNLCPQDAKFTALNSFDELLSDPRVDLITGAKVTNLDMAAGQVSGALYLKDGREHVARGDLYVLGANAMYSPWIMMRSGLGGHGLGQYLCEKMLVYVEVRLNGLNHFDGGTATTGFNTMLLDGEHRREHGAAVVLVENRLIDGLRTEWGRWRETMPIAGYIEDIPRQECGILADNAEFVTAKAFDWSDYAVRGREAFLAKLPDVLSALPVEEIIYKKTDTACHIQCTTRMGRTRDDSVVDAGLVHHDARNLVVVGNSVFPTVGSANPSLTTAALSLRAAHLLTGAP